MASESLLASSNIIAFVGTRNREAAKKFYSETLGIKLVSEDPFALVFDANGIMLRVTPVKEMTPARHTVLGWRVADIDRAVNDLRSGGVKFEQYGLPNQNEDGIWSAPGGARIAWFLDPDGNILSVSQHP